MQSQEQRPCYLLQLPPELIVAVSAHLDFSSLARFVQTCSPLNDVWATHSERISRAIAIRHGLTDPQSCGAAQPVVATGLLDAPSLPDPDHALDPAELERVLMAQRGMHDESHIASWRDFAKSRHRRNRNWLVGRATTRHLRLFDQQGAAGMPMFDDDVWRFKLDPDPGYIVATGVVHGLSAFSVQNGRRVWHTDQPFVQYAHVELSNGHFASTAGALVHAIWCRDDLAPTSEPTAIGTGPARPETAIGYSLASELRTNIPCSATKMRWPYFVAVANGSDEVYRWDLRTSPPERATLHMTPFWRAAPAGLGERRVFYVEIDSKAIYLAGEMSVLMWRHDEPGEGRWLCWPPDPPQGPIAGEPAAPVDPDAQASDTVVTHWRQPSLGGYAAVHHDGCGKHIVAAAGEEGERMRLYWTSDYLDTIWADDRDLLERKTVVLTIAPIGAGVAIVQLAVENGRAVFVILDADLGTSLWLINLRDFHDHADFVADPPKPVRFSASLLLCHACGPVIDADA